MVVSKSKKVNRTAVSEKHSEFSEVLPVLKKALRSKGVTYADLANLLKMSESGIKKIFNGKDCSFNKLARISEALDFGLSDLLLETKNLQPTDLTFSAEADTFLSENFDYFKVYWKLFYERKTASEIQIENKLTHKELFKYLHKLDRLKLIELYQDGKIRLPKAEFGYFSKSKLLNKMKNEWGKQVFEEAVSDEISAKKFFTLYYLRLDDDSFLELTQEMRSIIKKYTKETVRNVNMKKDSAKAYRMISCLVSGSFVKSLKKS